jgi:putative ABC transport system ATP-binding protein
MATIADYEILLLDEITSALDPIASDLVIETTRKIVSIEKKTCLFITHNMQHINKFSGKVVEIVNGQAVCK